ncbi:hypothetical protein WJX74_000968 [Apatococcus lobatus]|uniref:Uncharacterized protein n=1 Tax=Apatococcus lobatus TaxID=904363 RepID=A0AAW1Q711_9CHLO
MATAALASQELGAIGTSSIQSIQIEKQPFTCSAQVEFGSALQAKIICNTLAVDPELRPQQVTRELSVDGSNFIMKFSATDVKSLRAAVGTFCDLLGLAARTMEAFPPQVTAVA